MKSLKNCIQVLAVEVSKNLPGLLAIAVFCLFTLTASAQSNIQQTQAINQVQEQSNAPTKAEVSNSSNEENNLQKKAADRMDEFNKINAHIKALYESTHRVSLTMEQFRNTTNTTATNLENWKKVLQKYEGDETTDLTFIRAMVKGMQEKLTLKK
jgi:sensor domain CHASE-containing protein